MKKTLFIIGIFLLVSSSNLVQAHELIPKQIQSYLEQHPNATIDEVNNFINTKDELKDRFSNKEAIAKLIDRKTGFFDTFYDFAVAGVKHILEGPDHILFVLSLLLTLLSLKDLLKTTGVFTISHSISLILAGSGILTLSSNIVEPIIALSIAYVALTSIILKKYDIFAKFKNKLITVFVFGLFHGLGFAGLLQDIHIPKDQFMLSLLSFNIGIELGQIIIIAFSLPLIISIYKMRYRETILKIIAIAISLLAMFWFIQRLVA